MKCPRCVNPMRVTNTWDCGTVRKRREVCLRCHTVCQTSERVVEVKTSEDCEVIATSSNEEQEKV